VNHTRRQWIIRGSAFALGTSTSFSYQANPVSPLEDGPETERFRNAEKRALEKSNIDAESRVLALKHPALKVHVLVAGRGDPVILIHGGGGEAVQLAPLMSGLTRSFQCFVGFILGQSFGTGNPFIYWPPKSVPKLTRFETGRSVSDNAISFPTQRWAAANRRLGRYPSS